MLVESFPTQTEGWPQTQITYRVCCVCLVSGAVKRGFEDVVSASCNCLQECVCVS